MKDKIVVYGKCSGVATIATFLGNQWWITSKDEKLEPLYEESPYDKSDYRYLCEKDELILVKDLAGMMGCALMCGDENAKEILKSSFKDINAPASTMPRWRWVGPRPISSSLQGMA